MIPRLLLTGAAGKLGRHLRTSLRPYAQLMRLSDIAAMDPAGPAEELMPCQLADKQAVDRLVQGCNAVVHMGGLPTDHAFEDILEANIKGVLHIYEGARRHAVERVIFASSNHVVGFHLQEEVLGTDCVRRPDSYYGLSKSFGEDVAQFYWNRYGIQSASLRIGSAFPEPRDRRMMHTWLSYRDLTELIRCCLQAPHLGHTVVFGMSDNPEPWWDNSGAAHLGFKPQDSSTPFRSVREQTPPLAAADPARRYQGGAFVKFGPYDTPPVAD